MHILSKRKGKWTRGANPLCLVLAPTRELADQVCIFISISCNFKFVSHKKLAYACWSFFLWAWIVRGTQSSTMQVKIIWESAVEWFQQHGCCYNFSGLIFRRSYSRGFKTSTNAFIFPSKENRLSAYELRPFVGASRQSHLSWLLKEDDGMWEKNIKPVLYLEKKINSFVIDNMETNMLVWVESICIDFLIVVEFVSLFFCFANFTIHYTNDLLKLKLLF